MRLIETPPDPNFKLYTRSPSVDFIKFFLPSYAKCPIDSELWKIGLIECSLGRGWHLTIQTPSVWDVQTVHMSFPDARFIGLEVSIDFRPKGDLPLLERTIRREEMRRWLMSHLYPWSGRGIQYAHRVSNGRKRSELLFSSAILRSSERNETLYFGHRDDIYADSKQENFAFMRIYEKKTDANSVLLPEQMVSRIEVSLNERGCKHYELMHPGDLFGFNFRSLSEYFRLVKPMVLEPRPKRSRTSPALAEAIARKKVSYTEQVGKTAGAWALFELRHAEPTLRRHAFGNRIVGTMLDNLTKRYRRVTAGT